MEHILGCKCPERGRQVMPVHITRNRHTALQGLVGAHAPKYSPLTMSVTTLSLTKYVRSCGCKTASHCDPNLPN